MQKNININVNVYNRYCFEKLFSFTTEEKIFKKVLYEKTIYIINLYAHINIVANRINVDLNILF